MESEKLEKEEEETFEEFKKEAIKEVEADKNPHKYGKLYCVLSLVLSIIGFLFLFIFYPVSVFAGFISIILAKGAIEAGFKKLGRAAGIISFLDILGFVIQVSYILSGFA